MGLVEGVNADGTKLLLPPQIVKNNEPLELALTTDLTAALRKRFRFGQRSTPRTCAAYVRP